MELFFKYGNTRSLLNKLERERARAKEALDAQSFPDLADALYNFSITAYHIKDWLIAQNGIPDQDVHDFINNIPVLQACRDICNSKKHYEITRYKPSDVSVGSTLTEIISIVPNEEGGVDLYGKADIWVDVGESEAYRMIDFMENVLGVWTKYHDDKGI